MKAKQTLLTVMKRLDLWAHLDTVEMGNEPDMVHAHRVLQDNGISLQDISALLTRHLVTQLQEIIKEGMADGA